MDTEDILLGLLIGVIIAIPLALFLSKSPTTAPLKFTANKVYYENKEEWEIIKDPETGRTKGVSVKRTAKDT